MNKRSIQNLRTTDGNDIRAWDYGSDTTGNIRPPPKYSDYPKEIEEKVGKYEVKRPFVAEVQNAQLIGPKALTISTDGLFILENSLRSNHLFIRSLVETLHYGMVPTRRSASRSMDVAVSLVGPWSGEFFHWFADWLPKLEGALKYTRQTGLKPTLILPPEPPSWMTASVKAIGYEAEDWIEWSGGRLNVSRLIVPSLRRGSAFGSSGIIHSPDGFQWVRDRVLENMDINVGWTPNKIYISRADAQEREVLNEGDLVNVLEEKGFKRLVLSNYSYSEQVAIFANANCVVAPHGAGLVNIMYGDDLSVVELFGSRVNSCYFVLARAFEHEYACSVASSRGEDLMVQADQVTVLLDRINCN
ncbi:capsular polysaccharide biosynthesis protein [Halodesulfurarchaeum formicicum]|uniref:Capsular polysaccharide biosynthesis protein n=1 Tax=Halodesulfurarchaeum formicicum TaxID=1873524 RepID=A0A1D8S3W4_9EURY|nr:glycosyltransferase family 61 protein [Halodesulfurarchaeum formicicum]AOW80037.1 capsular polysaccharide biosynthesis protein [Halodesulfurarchaeum formicicum]